MPTTCSVKDCKKRGTQGGTISYHRFPAIILDEGERTRELSTRRRQAWIASLRRKDWEPTEHSRVCSVHFISGSQMLYVHVHVAKCVVFTVHVHVAKCVVFTVLRVLYS